MKLDETIRHNNDKQKKKCVFTYPRKTRNICDVCGPICGLGKDRLLTELLRPMVSVLSKPDYFEKSYTEFRQNFAYPYIFV